MLTPREEALTFENPSHALIVRCGRNDFHLYIERCCEYRRALQNGRNEAAVMMNERAECRRKNEAQRRTSDDREDREMPIEDGAFPDEHCEVEANSTRAKTAQLIGAGEKRRRIGRDAR